MDGLDAAVAELGWESGAIAMSPLRHIERPWPDEVRARLHASLGPTTAGELCELDQLIGQTSAELAAELLPADLVVSHGQTVHHWVADGEAKGTLQLGQPAWIVEVTGLGVCTQQFTNFPVAGSSFAVCNQSLTSPGYVGGMLVTSSATGPAAIEPSDPNLFGIHETSFATVRLWRQRIAEPEDG